MNQETSIAEPYQFERDYPTPDTARRILDEQEFHRAVESYRFFYPTVSAEAIFNGGREAGVEAGQALMVLSAGPRHVAFTANSDTPYASGVLDVTAGPLVVDVPPGPFIGLIDDHHQRWITDMGIPGLDGGQGGRHLLLPPDFQGGVPGGYHVRRSPTFKALIALRALPTEGNVAAAIEALRQVKVYPLANPTATLPYVDLTSQPIDATPLRWEDNLEFWRRLHAVIDAEPALPEFHPMYGELAALGIEQGKPFAPDRRTEQLLERAARVALDEMRVEAFASERPDRMVWRDRHWEWAGLVPDNANFESGGFIDLEARDRWFFQAIVASPAMFRRQAGGGSVYFLAARDKHGGFLDGGLTYKLSVPQPVPAKLFWSVTAYDAGTRSQVQTPQNKAVLGSLQQKFDADADGSVDLYFGPKPAPGREKQWIRTLPGTGFFLYFRIYGPEAPSLDGSWRLSDLERVPLGAGKR
jgi:hypothetical protein